MFHITYALNQVKICSNCRHFFLEKHNDNTLLAKCVYFKKKNPNIQECAKRKETIYLILDNIIVQKLEDKRDLYLCVTARTFQSMCGYEGKKYEEKNMEKNMEKK
jgi:hypothetical protein